MVIKLVTVLHNGRFYATIPFRIFILAKLRLGYMGYYLTAAETFEIPVEDLGASLTNPRTMTDS